jgi:hypothetical protein
MTYIFIWIIAAIVALTWSSHEDKEERREEQLAQLAEKGHSKGQ